MKHTITIDVEIPEGYEPVIVDGKAEWRKAQNGERFLSHFTCAANACMDGTDGRYLILRKSWQPPSWMPEGRWLYRNGTRWWFADSEPTMFVGGYTRSGALIVISAVDLALLYGETFTPPPVDKVQIRHGKVEARPTDTAAKDG